MTLLLLPFYLLLVIFVIRWILKQIEGRGKRWLMFLLLAFLFYLPLGWDVILGRAYFHYLCATQGGVHVYQTVELGPEYWNPDGSPKFIQANGELDEDFFNGELKIRRTGENNISKISNISVYHTRLVDVKKERVLAERAKYVYTSGWFLKYTGFSTGGISCGYQAGFYKNFLSKVLMRSVNKS